MTRKQFNEGSACYLPHCKDQSGVLPAISIDNPRDGSIFHRDVMDGAFAVGITRYILGQAVLRLELFLDFANLLFAFLRFGSLARDPPRDRDVVVVEDRQWSVMTMRMLGRSSASAVGASNAVTNRIMQYFRGVRLLILWAFASGYA